MRYKNRTDAALQLIPYLSKYKNANTLILGVPRGGVPIAYHIAKYYNFPLELLMIKKIGHPSNPEFAIGAVSPEDHIIDERQNISKTYVDEQIKLIRNNLEERYNLFMGNKSSIDFKDKTLIIVDDGIATGNTILSSISMLRKRKPAKIVIAVPVAPPDTARRLIKEVDDFICPYLPDEFFGVGYHYQDFSQVTDDEVIKFIKDIKKIKTNVTTI